MSCYVASNDNRVYVAKEPDYGTAGAITDRHRVAAIRLGAKQRAQRIQRRDKTGTRTYQGLSPEVRKDTDFDLSAYLTAWSNQSFEPGLGPLFEAALGGTPLQFPGGVAQGSSGVQLTFASAHGLQPGQAVVSGGEMRFVASVINAQTVALNAPFTSPVQAGTPIGKTITYVPGPKPGSVSLFDYWGDSEAVSRVLVGAAVDRVRMQVNGDLHEFEFSGPSQELIDTTSFEQGQAGLTAFPEEPLWTGVGYSLVPGHLGQAWLGSTANQFFTLTKAALTLENGIEMRNREFGSKVPLCVSAGERRVELQFSIFETGGAATQELYQAARQRSPIQVMLQLGEQAGQLFGVYCHSVVAETPVFDDGETRLQWQFEGRAQGGQDDEIRIAFG